MILIVDNETDRQRYFLPHEIDALTSLSAFCRGLTSNVSHEFDIVITGGFFAKYLHHGLNFPEQQGDIDHFILDGEPIRRRFERWLYRNYNNIQHREMRGVYSSTPNILDVYDANASVCLTPSGPSGSGLFAYVKKQFIVTKYKTRKELLDSFDFYHCKMSFHNGKLYTTRKIYDCIMQKRLEWQYQPSQWRIDKYVNKGWQIPSKP